jgi:hypothetical protein
MIAVRRTAVIGTSVLLSLAMFAPGASAGDVDDLLQAARDATYSANRVSVSIWGDQTQVADQWVEHWSGGEIVRTNSAWSVYGRGRAVTMGEATEGIAFVTQRTMPASERYSIGDVTEVTHLRRECKRVEIMEGDMLRAVLLVDKRSGAILHTEIYNDQGRIFRTVALDDFKPYRMYSMPDDPSSVPVEIVMHSESDELPSEIAGYQLVDVFPGPGGSEQGFFSDGMFSFSLFSMSRRTVVSGFEEPMPLVTSAGVYDMVPTARDVRIRWSDGSNTYVLVGDLPPDHARDVLNELPPPSTGSMFMRWWHRIFG